MRQKSTPLGRPDAGQRLDATATATRRRQPRRNVAFEVPTLQEATCGENPRRCVDATPANDSTWRPQLRRNATFEAPTRQGATCGFLRPKKRFWSGLRTLSPYTFSSVV